MAKRFKKDFPSTLGDPMCPNCFLYHKIDPYCNRKLPSLLDLFGGEFTSSTTDNRTQKLPSLLEIPIITHNNGGGRSKKVNYDSSWENNEYYYSGQYPGNEICNVGKGRDSRRFETVKNSKAFHYSSGRIEEKRRGRFNHGNHSMTHQNEEGWRGNHRSSENFVRKNKSSGRRRWDDPRLKASFFWEKVLKWANEESNESGSVISKYGNNERGHPYKRCNKNNSYPATDNKMPPAKYCGYSTSAKSENANSLKVNVPALLKNNDGKAQKPNEKTSHTCNTQKNGQNTDKTDNRRPINVVAQTVQNVPKKVPPQPETQKYTENLFNVAKSANPIEHNVQNNPVKLNAQIPIQTISPRSPNGLKSNVKSDSKSTQNYSSVKNCVSETQLPVRNIVSESPNYAVRGPVENLKKPKVQNSVKTISPMSPNEVKTNVKTPQKYIFHKIESNTPVQNIVAESSNDAMTKAVKSLKIPSKTVKIDAQIPVQTIAPIDAQISAITNAPRSPNEAMTNVKNPQKSIDHNAVKIESNISFRNIVAESLNDAVAKVAKSSLENPKKLNSQNIVKIAAQTPVRAVAPIDAQTSATSNAPMSPNEVKANVKSPQISIAYNAVKIESNIPVRNVVSKFPNATVVKSVMSPVENIKKVNSQSAVKVKAQASVQTIAPVSLSEVKSDVKSPSKILQKSKVQMNVMTDIQTPVKTITHESFENVKRAVEGYLENSDAEISVELIAPTVFNDVIIHIEGTKKDPVDGDQPDVNDDLMLSSIPPKFIAPTISNNYLGGAIKDTLQKSVHTSGENQDLGKGDATVLDESIVPESGGKDSASDSLQTYVQLGEEINSIFSGPSDQEIKVSKSDITQMSMHSCKNDGVKSFPLKSSDIEIEDTANEAPLKSILPEEKYPAKLDTQTSLHATRLNAMDFETLSREKNTELGTHVEVKPPLSAMPSELSSSIYYQCEVMQALGIMSVEPDIPVLELQTVRVETKTMRNAINQLGLEEMKNKEIIVKTDKIGENIAKEAEQEKTDAVHRLQGEQQYCAELFDSQLECPICCEPFVEATTLHCSHTFCKMCISQWKKNKKTCPTCRVKISVANPSLVLDTLIEKLTEKMSDEFKEHRLSVIESRRSGMTDNPLQRAELRRLMKRLNKRLSAKTQEGFKRAKKEEIVDESKTMKLEVLREAVGKTGALKLPDVKQEQRATNGNNESKTLQLQELRETVSKNARLLESLKKEQAKWQQQQLLEHNRMLEESKQKIAGLEESLNDMTNKLKVAENENELLEIQSKHVCQKLLEQSESEKKERQENENQLQKAAKELEEARNENQIIKIQIKEKDVLTSNNISSLQRECEALKKKVLDYDQKLKARDEKVLVLEEREREIISQLNKNKEEYDLYINQAEKAAHTYVQSEKTLKQENRKTNEKMQANHGKEVAALTKKVDMLTMELGSISRKLATQIELKNRKADVVRVLKQQERCMAFSFEIGKKENAMLRNEIAMLRMQLASKEGQLWASNSWNRRTENELQKKSCELTKAQNLIRSLQQNIGMVQMD